MARRGGEERHEEALPWLEPAEVDDDRATVISGRGLGLGILVLGGLLLLVVALIYAQIARPEEEEIVYASADGEAPLIAAPDAPFKVRPADPGGLDLEGLTQTAHEAAGGVDPGGTIALDALPEEPIDRSVLAAEAAPRPGFEAQAPVAPAPVRTASLEPDVAKPEAKQPAKTETPAKPAEPKPEAKKAETKVAAKTEPKNEVKEPAPDDDGSYSLQLGAFSSQAKANEAWKTITGRYAYLADLEKSVIALDRDGAKLYRLRATGLSSRARADNLCARLRVAGDQCSVVD